MKNFADSARCYEKAVGMGLRDQTLYANLAYTYEQLGKEKEAVNYYKKVSPPDTKTSAYIAGYYLKEKQFPEAIKYYQQLVKLEPRKASSYFSLGYAHSAAGSWDRAIENYLMALKYDREDDEIYANLGVAYEQKGLYADALKAYRSAYEINPQTKVASRIPRLRIQLMKEKK